MLQAEPLGQCLGSPLLLLACPPCPAAESRTTTIYAFHTLSYISEGIIFVYCGLDALDPLKWQVGRRAGPPMHRSCHKALARVQAGANYGDLQCSLHCVQVLI